MKKLLFILLISTSLFAQFRSYEVVQPKTLEDLNTGQIEIAIDKFALGWSITNVVRAYYVDRGLVKKVFKGIKAIENYASRCMNGTAVEGIDKVTRQSDLLAMVNLKFPNYTDTNAYLLSKMVQYSKKNGSGDWSFYKSQFTE